MSLIHPLARSVERFVYDGVCSLSKLTRADIGHAPGVDTLASPFDPSDLTRRG